MNATDLEKQMATATDEIIEALRLTSESSINLLQLVADFGNKIQFQLRPGYDAKRDELCELRVKTEHMKELLEMFETVELYLKGFSQPLTIDEVEELFTAPRMPSQNTQAEGSPK